MGKERILAGGQQQGGAVRGEDMQELTGQQKLFVHEYMVDLNALQACIRAGYSEKTAGTMSAKLMAKPHIKAAIDKQMAKRTKKTDISAERVLEEYAKIAFADIKDFLRYGTEKTVVGYTGDGQPVVEYRQVVDAKPSEEVDGTLINEVSIGKDGTFKFKLHDKKGALDMVGKHLGMFTDNININGNMVIFKGEDDLED